MVKVVLRGDFFAADLDKNFNRDVARFIAQECHQTATIAVGCRCREQCDLVQG